MSLLAGIGFSQHPDTVAAAKEAASRARQQLAEERIDLALVFNTFHYDPKVFLPVLNDALDQTRLLGSSTAGIILPGSIESRGIAVFVLYSDSIKFNCAIEGHLNLQDFRAAGKNLAKNCCSEFGQQHRKAFLFFADGLLHNISGIVRGIKQQLGEDFYVFGAGSSDNYACQRTYQYYKNTFVSKGVVGLLLGGHLNFAAACQHGWHPLGKPRLIDQVEQNVIHSIDRKPALRLYEEYFSREAMTLKDHPFGQINIRYPLGVRTGHANDYLLRNILTTLDDGSIICQDSVNPDTEGHVMIMNLDSCTRVGQNAAQQIQEQLKNHAPSVVLVFESAARAKLLGRNVLKELRLITSALGPIPLLGLQTYGEIYSYRTEKNTVQTLLQNNSIMLLGLS